MYRIRFAGLLLLLSLTGCAVNPVTGERQLITVSPQQEIAMGEQAYGPTQQSQGGEYDVDPELTAYVQRVGARVAAYAENPLPYEFVVLNNSVPNAWALPGGKIAINRGLLTELDSEAELAAVLGHEVVHAAARHSAQQMTRSMLSQVLVVATAVVARDSQYGNLAVGGAATGAQLINSAYGRGAELESDKYGMRYMSKAGYDPTGAITLQETFVRLSEGRRQDWLSGLFASHPPSPSRVAANRQTASTLPAGGELGVDPYERALAKTRRIKPAYDAYDEGRQALADGDRERALSLANRALDLFPDEAHFHSLRGDIRLTEKNYAWAETNYTRAIDRREDFFYYHLQRGMARREQGELDGARRDLEASLELMPTAPAHYTLGTLAEDRGDVATALEHYKVLAGQQGDYGAAARGRIARLDLPGNPSAYIPFNCVADGQQQLIVQVRNDAPEALRNIRVAVGFTGADGRSRERSHAYRGQLAPGQIANIATGLAPYTGGGCPVRVIGAEFAN
ncbi:MAG: M48 family metalloprotease [Pseudomonadota bacterium]